MLESIKSIIENDIHGGAKKLEPDQNLFETGVLDSLSHLKLISLLEDKYAIKFSMKEMKVENFETLSKLAVFIQEKIAGKAKP
ncbi:MAG TPA: acyl carrier protein [Bdellovibrionales bacterium]|nr:acyl carrier protein [Bdellovibrionales bacterium]